MERKRYLVNKNTSLVSSGIGLLWLPENKKTLREPQNAALRTSHRLSYVSNCSFQKYSEGKNKIKNKLATKKI